MILVKQVVVYIQVVAVMTNAQLIYICTCVKP